MPQIKVILIGLTHPHVFSRLTYLAGRDDISLLGYYEKDESTALRMKPFTSCHCYTDLSSLLATDFHVAIIHGLDRENAFYMQDAIDAGAKGIFVEKPGVSQPAQFYPLAKQISEKNIAFECGWELHYSEPARLARQIIREGVLGSVTTARFHGGCPAGAGLESWQSDPSNLGGFFYSIGGHSIESVVDFFNLPTRVVSSIRKLPAQPSFTGFSLMPGVFGPKVFDPTVAVGSVLHEDIGSAILEYPGFNVTLDFTAWEPNGYCEEWAIDIYGTRGALHLTLDPPSGTLLLREDSGPWKKGRNALFANDDGSPKLSAAFLAQMDSFFHRVNGDLEQEHPCNEKATRDLLVLFQALYVSSKTQSWVEVKL